MTGATIIMRKGGTIVLSKVRFEGMGVEEFFVNLHKPKEIFSIPIEDLWPEFLKWRRSGWVKDSISLTSEIDTMFDNGFKTNINKLSFPFNTLLTGEDFDQIERDVCKMISLVNPDDGYLCGYNDHELIIDYDTETISRIVYTDPDQVAVEYSIFDNYKQR